MTDVTPADIENTKPSVPDNATELRKINVTLNADNKWEASLEYRDGEGKAIQGETRSFDEFSQASAWVAGSDVEVHQNQDQGAEQSAEGQTPS